MKVPDGVRDGLIQSLWKAADELSWITLTDRQRATQYESWVRSEEVGGVLARYMDRGAVRVYLKDSLLKPYTRVRLESPRRPFLLLGLAVDSPIIEHFIKPHGVRLNDGKVVCWGLADEWKRTIVACFERTFQVRGAIPFGVVLLAAGDRYRDPAARRLVEELARRLGVQTLTWDESLPGHHDAW
jgi:hypothetical protein